MIARENIRNFCIIAHVFEGPRVRAPHDHGPSWAIYGQVEGTTNMTEFAKVEPPTGGRPGKVEPVKSYDLEPGMAVAYDVGDLHAPVDRLFELKVIRLHLSPNLVHKGLGGPLVPSSGDKEQLWLAIALVERDRRTDFTADPG